MWTKSEKNWYDLAMERLALNSQEKRALAEAFKKPFQKLDAGEQRKVLELGAKDFSRRFGATIKKLSNE